ncbi:MAG: baseplate J/gp47 family protein [Anaerolineaceae bacterium]|nr:baseplate J/gp47 family protein [Anaerolineaceae bacterium]
MSRPELLQLERNEDVASVRSRLLPMASNQLLLVWPVRGTALTRRLDLVLVQREAQRLGIQLALLTQDPDVIRHARELNLSTFATVGASERGRWKRGRARLFLPQRQVTSNGSQPESLEESAIARLQAARKEPPGVLRLTGGVVLLLVVLALGAAAALLIVPEATVTFLPARNLVQTEVLITADPDAASPDLDNAIVPALPLNIIVEESASMPPGGRQILSSSPARGSVTFVNLGSDPVDIPAGTLVGTGGARPVWFNTLTGGALDAGAGSQLELPVEATADNAGAVGNVASGHINSLGSQLALRVSVRNRQPTSGGSSRSVGIVLPEDQERLLATIRQQIKSQAYISLLSRLDDNQYLILESINLATERSDWTRFSAAPGDAAETLRLDMKAIVEAVAIDESHAQQILLNRLESQVETDKHLLAHTVHHDRGPVVSDYADGFIRFSRSAHGLTESVVDTDALRQQLAGLSLAEARRIIHQNWPLQPGTTPLVEVTPGWHGRLPFLTLRIQVLLAEQT